MEGLDAHNPVLMQAPVQPYSKNVVQVPRRIVLQCIRIHQWCRDVLGLAPPQLLSGMFVAVRAADIMPGEYSHVILNGSSIPDPAEAAALPMRLRQISGLGAVGKSSSSPADTVVLLAGGPSYSRESVRVGDILDIDIQNSQHIAAHMTVTEEVRLDIAEAEERTTG